jgi:putative transposase
VQAIETMPDHMHILFDAYPQLNLAEFINAFKSASSRQIRKSFSPELAQYYWKPYFWSLSYFIGSVSDKTAAVVKNYINNQKIK